MRYVLDCRGVPDQSGVGGAVTITYHNDLIQGSDEWLKARLGLITASEMKFILTPTLKAANNEKTRAHVYELLAQRITQYVEPSYISDDMLRGKDDEVYARAAYMEHYGDVQDVGFITNSKWGFTLGYSPDGLVGTDGLIECKSRKAKYQIQTIIENVWNDKSETIPDEFMMQCQTGLMVAEREWIDLMSYSNGLPMVVIRVHPIPEIQGAILEAVRKFEDQLSEGMAKYQAAMKSDARLVPTERRIELEMFT